MKKKIIYIAILIIALILGYFNYFGDDEKLDNTQQVIETTNVTYKNDDYVVEAEKQKDYVKEKETGFEKAQAKVNDMLLSGDNVFIDKVRNLALKHNILGVSPNGWRFSAETANYNKLEDKVTSDTGVTAENEARGIKISGQNFTTDSKMSYINLEKDVVLENRNVALKGDRGDYTDATKIVNLADNITLEGRGKDEGLLGGHFKHLKYNMQDKILEAWEPYDITYKDVKLSAESLYLKEDTEALRITKNVQLEANGFVVDLQSIDKKPNSNILNLNGKLVGKSDEYSFVADSGRYNTDTKILEIFGNIRGKSKTGELLVADKLVYDTNTKVMIVTKADGVKYSNADGELVTREFTYNFNTKELATDGHYTFKGKKYESEGQNLYYNDISKDIKLTKGYIYDKIKKERVKGDTILHNMTTKDSSVTGNGYIENTTYALSSEKIQYKGAEKIAIIPEKYKVTYLKDGSIFRGKDANYNENTNDFVSKGEVIVEGKNYIAHGRDLEYNSKTGFGKFNSKIEIENPKDNMLIKGDNFTFQNGKYIDISGNLNMETDKFTAKSQEGKYNFDEKKIYIPEMISFASKDGKTSGTTKNGIYSTDKNYFHGKIFDGVNENSKVKSKNIYYYTKENRVLFTGNVVMESPESIVRGENVEYYPESETIKLIGEYTINYKDFTFEGVNGTFSNKTGILHGEKSVITSKTGDRFVSDRVDGNLNDLVLDFSGNINGHISNNGEVTNFKGDYARLYFKHDKKYELLRSEVRENAVFVQNEKTLYSDYIEVDPERNLVFSRDNTKLVIDDPKNGKTIITSDAAELDSQKDIATLIGNVKVDNMNKERGLTKITADRGIINKKDNTLEFTGHVEIENNDSTVQADKGIYNMNTKKIKALGNVYVDYKK